MERYSVDNHDNGGNFFVGILWALLLSVPIYALIAVAIIASQ